MSDAGLAIQQAAFNAASTALDPTPVYDAAPEDVSQMYVLIGDAGTLPDDTKTGSGIRTTIQFRVFSQKRGLREVKTALATLYNTFHQKRLTVSGFESQELQFEFSDAFFDPMRGGNGVIRFSIPTQPE